MRELVLGWLRYSRIVQCSDGVSSLDLCPELQTRTFRCAQGASPLPVQEHTSAPLSRLLLSSGSQFLRLQPWSHPGLVSSVSCI